MTALASNRYCRYPDQKIEKREEIWNQIRIIRIWRPAWNQAHKFLRLANSIWMILGWFFKILMLPRKDVIILGTDPQFSPLLFFGLKWFVPKSKLVHWCYDLYPEAIISDGAKGASLWFARRFKKWMGWAYKRVDLMVDIGPCMRKRLDAYHHRARAETLVPWALVEPDQIESGDFQVRRKLFGDAKLGLLYSGNMGKAHDFSLFLQLARELRVKNSKVVFCFACRGNRFQELREAVTLEDSNIRFASFANEEDLEKRLNAADIHLASLRSEWDGVVVPSKFFGSLAVGKPVIYAGSENSSLAEWIREFKVGLILTDQNISSVRDEILKIAESPQQLQLSRENAYNVYRRFFSKKVVMDKWNRALRDLIQNSEREVELN